VVLPLNKILLKLTDILHDTIFIGTTVDELTTELSTNTWRISLSSTERTALSGNDLVNFFDEIIQDRHEQLRQSNVKHGLIFYLWHDRQASQLRFSLISDFHKKLPFQAETVSASLVEIIHEFLRSPDHIPFSELEISDDNAGVFVEVPQTVYRVRVFQIHLPQTN
jgi:hypothetical protein